jgi:hypothetical protein
MKKVSGPFFQKRCQDCASFIFVLLFALGSAQAQNCPPIDVEKQKAAEQACLAAGGAWARFGVYAHLCGIYSCVERTTDGGRLCRDRSDCQHLCITDRPAVIGAEASGRCTALRSNIGCFTHVDDGQIVGRVCVD